MIDLVFSSSTVLNQSISHLDTKNASFHLDKSRLSDFLLRSRAQLSQIVTLKKSSKRRLDYLTIFSDNSTHLTTIVNIYDTDKYHDSSCEFCVVKKIACVKMIENKHCALCAFMSRTVKTCDDDKKTKKTVSSRT